MTNAVFWSYNWVDRNIVSYWLRLIVRSIRILYFPLPNRSSMLFFVQWGTLYYPLPIWNSIFPLTNLYCIFAFDIPKLNISLCPKGTLNFPLTNYNSLFSLPSGRTLYFPLTNGIYISLCPMGEFFFIIQAVKEKKLNLLVF